MVAEQCLGVESVSSTFEGDGVRFLVFRELFMFRLCAMVIATDSS
jgi:hypothetical protein